MRTDWYNPTTGCGVHTIGHSKKPTLWVVQNTIRFTQRWLMHIPSPYWRLTHSMGYVGQLNPRDIDAAERVGLITAAVARELRRRTDWCLSMTDPVGIWVPFDKVMEEHAGRGLIVSRPQFCRFDEEWQIRAWHHACWWWIERKYDRRQLVNILANELGEDDPKVYDRYLPDPMSLSVCSGAIASCYEAVRRQGIIRMFKHADGSEWISSDADGVGLPEWNDYALPWPRILGGRHLERVAPGHLCLRPWFEAA